jgi:hypothetical protein
MANTGVIAMPELNASIRDIPLPPRMARRPVSDKGFPVPWFATHVSGDVWDFVNVDPRKMGQAYGRKLCWLCGEPLGQYFAFVIGPMCAVNRVSSEPPSHRECAEYAVRACPFLARPKMRRNDEAHRGKVEDTPGIMLAHNPGVALIWITKAFVPYGGLFHIGVPVAVAWFAEGRNATRAEVDAAIDKGLPFLRDLATKEGPAAVAEMEAALVRAQQLLPSQESPP